MICPRIAWKPAKPKPQTQNMVAENAKQVAEMAATVARNAVMTVDTALAVAAEARQTPTHAQLSP